MAHDKNRVWGVDWQSICEEKRPRGYTSGEETITRTEALIVPGGHLVRYRRQSEPEHVFFVPSPPEP